MEWVRLQESLKRADVLLVAVSKARSVEEISALYRLGQRDFGESKVQEADAKRPLLPADIRWHLIGTLQTKKVAKVVGRYQLIHSVDSLELAQKLSEVSLKHAVTTNILLQVNTSRQASKHGFSPETFLEAFDRLNSLPALSLKGLMTMAPQGSDKAAIHRAFRDLKMLQEEIQKKYGPKVLTELSMGMSADYEVAIEEGATIVRIGSLLFEASGGP